MGLLQPLVSQNVYSAGYGISNESVEILKDGGPSILAITFEEKRYQFETNIWGEHNLLNLASVLIYLLSEKFSFTKLLKLTQKLKMVKRRQEYIGHYKNIPIYDDFAHHPRAIKLTIEMFRKKTSGQLIVIFEPMSATARSSLFQEEFKDSLQLADRVILIKPRRQNSIAGLKDLDCNKLIKDLSDTDCTCLDTF